MAAFTRNGYGQVEPNQLSFQKTGQIYASLPLDNSVSSGVQILQNGEFMYYSYADNMVTSTPVKGFGGEPMLVFNEVKLYDGWRESYKDFAMIRVGDNYATSNLATQRYGDGALTTGVNANPAHTEYPYRMDGIVPRLVKTNVGDIYTTNMVKLGEDYQVGDKLTPKKVTKQGDNTGNTLVLEKADDNNGMLWQVIKVYTMPDGQPGLKLQRVQ